MAFLGRVHRGDAEGAEEGEDGEHRGHRGECRVEDVKADVVMGFLARHTARHLSASLGVLCVFVVNASFRVRWGYGCFIDS